MIDPQLLSDNLKNVLIHFPEISLVYLFGSQATGYTGALSDIDFGILVDDNIASAHLQAQITHELCVALGIEHVDVVMLNHAPIELAYAVIGQGVLLYQRDLVTRVEYEATVMSLYGDYLPALRMQRQDILRGGMDERRIQRYRMALERTERTLSQITTSKK